MANNIQISDLKFDEIKQSLINYLKTTETFKDYDFSGSAINTLVELLSYNTFYYGFYSNMIANEMFLDTAQLESSLVSLTKPLGYLLINTKSAQTNITMTGLAPKIDYLAAFSKFKGYDINGSVYYFYNIKNIPVQTQATGELVTIRETSYFPVYEAKYVVYKQQVGVDLDRQEFLLVGKEIDPRTIVVEVTRNNVTETWENYETNNDVVVGPNTKVFFLERKTNGYMVMFGKQSETEESFSTIGEQILEDDEVVVSYLVSSGAAGNNIANISFVSDGESQGIATPTTEIAVLYPSRGGQSQPNVDSIRFFAPKTFARQKRLVTKNDYYAALNELGYGGDEVQDFYYKVFGGEEANPPYHGRVFVSILDLNPEDDDTNNFTELNQINEVMSALKSQSVVTVLPEYVPPVDVSIKLNINAILSAPESVIAARRTAIETALFGKYETRKYNTDVIEEEIKDIIRQASPGTIVNDNSIFVYGVFSTKTNTNQYKILNFKNKIATSPEFNVEIKLTDAIVRDDYDTKKLYRYNLTTGVLLDTNPVGEVNYEDGIVTLYPNFGIHNDLFNVQVRARDDNFYAKDEFIVSLSESNLNLTINPF